jgi:hypothetical protein
MTATQAKLIWAGATILIAWWFTDKPRTASVELGVGTVNGVYGNDIYYSAHGVIAPTADNPAEDPEMRRLIDQSNAAIAAAGGTP